MDIDQFPTKPSLRIFPQFPAKNYYGLPSTLVSDYAGIDSTNITINNHNQTGSQFSRNEAISFFRSAAEGGGGVDGIIKVILKKLRQATTKRQYLAVQKL